MCSHWKRGWRDVLVGHARSDDDMFPNMTQEGIEEKEIKEAIQRQKETQQNKIFQLYMILEV